MVSCHVSCGRSGDASPTDLCGDGSTSDMSDNGHMRHVVRVVPLLLVAVFVVAGVTWVSLSSVRDVTTTSAADEARPASPLRVAVVGDSRSAGRSLFLGNGLDEESWMSYADGDGIEFAGGWARSGATPEQMAEAVRPVQDADVLVVLAGTNAVLHGQTVQETASAYERIAEVVDADHVLVSAIPPYRAHAEDAIAYNRDLHELTARKGWTWVDPWASARDGTSWAAGFSDDGVHPAGPDQYRELGKAFRRLILEDRTSGVLAGR